MALRNSTTQAVLASKGFSDGLPSPPSSRTVSYKARPAATVSIAPPELSARDIISIPVLKPVPIIHTTAYLQQTQQLVVVPQLPQEEEAGEVLQLAKRQQSELSSNALVWALKKVDDQLNQVEQQPSELHQAIYDFTNGPVGQATSKGVQTAAKLTMSATIEAAKAAAPVGKWALQQGFKAAVGLVGAAMDQERQQKQKQRKQGK